MKRLLLVIGLIAAACTSKEGPQGETGAQGPQGVQGVAGPQGPEGPQGPQGQVLVLDGGVVTGPQGARGASVALTALPPGGACATGGTLVSLEDGGSPQVLCNGAAGATGATGPAGTPGVSVKVEPLDGGACPEGGVQVTAPDGGVSVVCNGVSVVATTLLAGDAHCANGGTRFVVGASTSYACNGAQGPQGLPGSQGAQGTQGVQGPQGLPGAPGATGSQGPQGATGSQGPAGAAGAVGPQGPQGPQGLQGPAGPTGPALLLDGGSLPVAAGDGFAFAGYTSATYNGNLGGITGGNGKCDAEFSGSHLCTYREFLWSAPATSPGAGGAWVDQDAYSSSSQPNIYPRDRSTAACTNWTSASNPSANYSSYSYLQPTGFLSNAAYDVCQVTRQLACCRSPHRWFRGYTSATYTGNLGGILGANAKCHAEYGGSHLCTYREYLWAGPSAGPGGAGAWIDQDAYSSSSQPNIYPRDRSTAACTNWTSASNPSANYSSYSYLQPTGYLSNAAYDVCQTTRQLACCG